MGIDAFLESENGKQIKSVPDPKEVLAYLLDSAHVSKSKLRLLNYVDPYGNTVFNTLQADDVIHDLEWLASKTSNKEHLQHLKLLQKLAVKMKSNVHTYLKFYGD